jgi:hypothetical protein
MIRHIVFFSVKNNADLQTVLNGLRLLCDIPVRGKVEISKNLHTDALSDEVDIVVYGEFEDQEALDAYKAHRIYQDSIDIVRPLRELRIAADVMAQS